MTDADAEPQYADDLAYDEARNLNNNYIGTEHLLLGLIREGDGLAGRVLAKLGFEVTGEEQRHCLARGADVACETLAKDLRERVAA